MLRNILAPGCCDVHSAKQNLTCGCRAQSGQCMHRQRLARAILPKHGKQLAMANFEIECIDQYATRYVDP